MPAAGRISAAALCAALAWPGPVAAAPAKTAVKPSPASQAANRAGWELMKQRKWLDAIPEFERAVAADPRHRTAWNNLGVCRLRVYESGVSATTAVTGALAAFMQVEALEAGSAGNLAIARAYADQEGAWAAAAAARAGQPAPEPAATGTYATYKAAGEAAERAGDFALAQANYARAEAVANAPRGRGAAANVQGLLALRRRDPGAAVDHLRRATTLDAANKFAWNNLGVALRRHWEAGAGGRELVEEAVSAFAKVAALDDRYKPENLSDARALLEALGPAPSATTMDSSATGPASVPSGSPAATPAR